MSIYDLDTKEYARNNIPPDKRLPKFLNLVYSLLSALQYNIDLYAIYRNGDELTYWNVLTLYIIGDQVTYQGKNYIVIADNDGTIPSTNPLFWTVTNEHSTGSDERMRYQPNKLIFEYALNKYFGGVFRQPPLISDIFVTNTAYFNPSKIIGGIESNSSIVYANSSTGVIINDYFVQFPYSFEVNIPTALYNDAGGNDQTILNFVNKFVVAGKTAIIVQY